MKSNLNDPSFSTDIFSSAFLIGNIGAPFVIGLAVGYFAKKMLRTALFLAGGAIVLLFASEYYGVINVTDAELQVVANSATAAAKSSGDFLVGRLSSITSKGVSGVAGFFLGFKLG
ncbi:MAG: FUN14 domain-containing protein [Methylovulum sp.]|nr:FUN14 domain-containing protein [Methylovulum sp.]